MAKKRGAPSSPAPDSMSKKAKREVRKKAKEQPQEEEEPEVPLTRFQSDSEDENEDETDGESGSDDSESGIASDEDETAKIAKNKKVKQAGKWTNKQRVLVFGSRGIGFRDRHLMDDLRTMMPHSKTDSKMQRKDTLFVVNEIAEMKNCNKCLLFEGRKGRKDLYLWAANIARGPSAKFLIENVHTMAELKMTGNCLKSSRPLLSFDKSFDSEPHFALLKELFTQIFSVPNFHPKSQPFFDHVYTFSVVDGKVWFRNYQILTEEDGSLAEIGPRFVMNPIKIFGASFSGETLWENGDYVTPNAHRSMMKKLKSGKYRSNVASKAAYEASRPTEPTYNMDPTDEIFANDKEDEEDKKKKESAGRVAPPKRKKKIKKKGSLLA